MLRVVLDLRLLTDAASRLRRTCQASSLDENVLELVFTLY